MTMTMTMTTNDDERRKRPPVFDDPDNYPAISLYQPWAGLIWLAGMGFIGKELETRPNRIHYRGALVIGAAQRVEPEAFADARQRLVGGGHVPAALFDTMCGKESAGKALAQFDVVGCRPMTEADHDLAFTDLGPGPHDVAGKFVWEGGDILALDPFKVSGAQGFFRVPKANVEGARKHGTTREERAKARATMAAENGATKCPCGSPFPKHLAEFMNDDSRCAHTCRCNRKYAVQGMKFVVVGTQNNPFTEARHG
jgi:hypothetical protein